MAEPTAPLLLGCDFSSSPGRRKPIVLALGRSHGARVQLQALERFETLAAFGQWLAQPPREEGGWVGGFDLPFGLPRELVQALGWPTDWPGCMQHYRSLSREQIRAEFAAFCDARPVGGKFAHRATDGPAGSSPSMKWVNPPVAYMLHAGVPLLIDAGVHLPGLHAGDPGRVALEAYPGLLAREVLQRRSYKSDDRAKQTTDRLIARKDLVNALEMGQTRLGLRLKLSHAQRDALVDDASGDSLDAVLCLLQAAWAQQRHAEGDGLYGLPPGLDALEGWIVTTPMPVPAGAPRSDGHSKKQD
ncbi:DUF429 domain-containing protein [Acidovorax sp. sic0104]|uniref:DUF429 domain-containing protein n=1 Tax=Acidovorax sp. sic0104 TaxID=2854784 RepID=UPI001C480026|nr:DUF429 domain-containing protein [Acidovorax sp. sic0104]MBV7539884.1 DUF429 domain-containing protein [Acidovorax sp. sic0104]